MKDQALQDMSGRSYLPSNRSNLDVLEDWLSLVNVQADVLLNTTYCGDWKIDLAQQIAMPLHIIGAGGCLLISDGQQRILAEGDWVFLPRNQPHRLQPLSSSQQLVIVLCGAIQITGQQDSTVLDWLPNVWHIEKIQKFMPDSLTLLQQLVVSELQHGEQANRLILNKLCETLFLMLLRKYARARDAQSVQTSTFTDARIEHAVQLMHQKPEQDWHVGSLAKAVGMSRTSFAIQFRRQIKQSPMQYLGEWRMNHAIHLLQQQQQCMTDVAAAVGYQSEGAFRKAFLRIKGFTIRQSKKQQD